MNRGTGRAEVSGKRCAKMTAKEDWVFSLAAPRRGTSALRAAVARGCSPRADDASRALPAGPRATAALPAETENARGTGTGAHLTAARQDVRTHGSELELRRRLTAGRGVGGHPRGRNARGGSSRYAVAISCRRRIVGNVGTRSGRGPGAARAWGHAAVAAADNLLRSAPRGGRGEQSRGRNGSRRTHLTCSRLASEVQELNRYVRSRSARGGRDGTGVSGRRSGVGASEARRDGADFPAAERRDGGDRVFLPERLTSTGSGGQSLTRVCTTRV